MSETTTTNTTTILVPELNCLGSYEATGAATEEMKAALDAAVTYVAGNPVYAHPSSLEARECIETFERLLDTVDEAGYETIPDCMGTTWLFRNLEAFAKLINEPIQNLLRRHMHHYIGDVLCSSKLLSLIEPSERSRFVRDVLTHATPAGNTWVRVLLDTGMSRAEVAELVLYRLEITKVDLRYNMADFVRSTFLQHSSGYVLDNRRRPYFESDDPTMWSVLTDEELTEALRICAQKVPGVVLKEQTVLRSLQARFTPPWGVSDQERQDGEELIRDILARHADRLVEYGTNLSDQDRSKGLWLNYDAFRLLPEGSQHAIFDAFEGCNTGLLVRAAVDLADFGLFKRYAGALALREHNHYGEVFIDLQDVLRVNGSMIPFDYEENPNPKIKVAGAIDECLRGNLRSLGYVIGRVDDRVIRGRGRKVVLHNGWTYIHDNYYARGYYPSNGDVVIFKGEKGKPRPNTRNTAREVIFKRINALPFTG